MPYELPEIDKPFAQRAFDAAWERSVVKQYPRSIGTGSCVYCSPNGLSQGCHIGILLTPDLYDPNMEGATICELVKEHHPAIQHLFPNGTRGLKNNSLLRFYSALQRVHDLEFDMVRIRIDMGDMAKKFNLQIPV